MNASLIVFNLRSCHNDSDIVMQHFLNYLEESNIGFTFGGQWNGGDRSNINNWISESVVPMNNYTSTHSLTFLNFPPER